MAIQDPSERRGSFTYRLNLVSLEEDVPLLMRFIKKPLRSQEFLRKASDPTRANSILNLHLDENNQDDEHELLDLSVGPVSPEHALVRKKLGELLKLLLKESLSPSYFDKKRSKSLPTTPTFKLVHFGGGNDVRYFKQKDKPAAILAANSPENSDWDEEEDDDEDAYEALEDELTARHDSSATTKYPNPRHGKLIDWDLQLPNFAAVVYDAKMMQKPPVFLERVFITVDKKYLLGHIAARNLLFEKSIFVRYTIDLWSTIVEVPAIYAPDVPLVLKCNNYDRFIFQIPLEGLFNSCRPPERGLENGYLHLRQYDMCIKYVAAGNEFWDNNATKNYIIRLTKSIRSPDPKTKPPNPQAAQSSRPSLARQSSGRLAPKKPERPPSKVDDHGLRPKYSSLYLRRRVSDLELTKTSPEKTAQEPENVFYTHEDSSSDFSDFIKNNYYLSSPMLSSLRNPAPNDEFFAAPGDLPDAGIDTLSIGNTPSSSISSIGSQPSVPSKLGLSPAAVNSKLNSRAFRSKVLDTASYKELLDLYCFFQSPEEENGAKTPNFSDSTLAFSNHGSPGV